MGGKGQKRAKAGAQASRSGEEGKGLKNSGGLCALSHLNMNQAQQMAQRVFVTRSFSEKQYSRG